MVLAPSLSPSLPLALPPTLPLSLYPSCLSSWRTHICRLSLKRRMCTACSRTAHIADDPSVPSGTLQLDSDSALQAREMGSEDPTTGKT